MEELLNKYGLQKFSADFLRIGFSEVHQLYVFRESDFDKFRIRPTEIEKRQIQLIVDKAGPPQPSSERNLRDNENQDTEYRYTDPRSTRIKLMEDELNDLEYELNLAKERLCAEQEKYPSPDQSSGTQCKKCHLRGHKRPKCPDLECTTALNCGDFSFHKSENDKIKVMKDAVGKLTTEFNKKKGQLELKKKTILKNVSDLKLHEHVINSNPDKYTVIRDGVREKRGVIIKGDMQILKKAFKGEIPKDIEKYNVRQIIETYNEDTGRKQKPDKTEYGIRKICAEYNVKFPGARPQTSRVQNSETESTLDDNINFSSVEPQAPSIATSETESDMESKFKSDDDFERETQIALKRSLEDTGGMKTRNFYDQPYNVKPSEDTSGLHSVECYRKDRTHGLMVPPAVGFPSPQMQGPWPPNVFNMSFNPPNYGLMSDHTPYGVMVDPSVQKESNEKRFPNSNCGIMAAPNSHTESTQKRFPTPHYGIMAAPNDPRESTQKCFPQHYGIMADPKDRTESTQKRFPTSHFGKMPAPNDLTVNTLKRFSTPQYGIMADHNDHQESTQKHFPTPHYGIMANTNDYTESTQNRFPTPHLGIMADPNQQMKNAGKHPSHYGEMAGPKLETEKPGKCPRPSQYGFMSPPATELENSKDFFAPPLPAKKVKMEPRVASPLPAKKVKMEPLAKRFASSPYAMTIMSPNAERPPMPAGLHREMNPSLKPPNGSPTVKALDLKTDRKCQRNSPNRSPTIAALDLSTSRQLSTMQSSPLNLSLATTPKRKKYLTKHFKKRELEFN